MARSYGVPEEAIKTVREIAETARTELKSTAEKSAKRLYKKDGTLTKAGSKSKVRTEKLARALQKHMISVDENTLRESEETFLRAAEQIVADSQGVIKSSDVHELLIFMSAGALTEFSIDNIPGYLQGDFILKSQKTGADQDSHIQLKASGAEIGLKFTKSRIESTIKSEFNKQFQSGASHSQIGLSNQQIQTFAAALADKGKLWQRALERKEAEQNLQEFIRMIPELSAADFFLFGFSKARSTGSNVYQSSLSSAGIYNLSVPSENLIDMYYSDPKQFRLEVKDEKKQNKPTRLVIRFSGETSRMKNVFRTYADNPKIALHHPVPEVFYKNRGDDKSLIKTYNRNIQNNHFDFIHLNIFGDYRKGK